MTIKGGLFDKNDLPFRFKPIIIIIIIIISRMEVVKKFIYYLYLLEMIKL